MHTTPDRAQRWVVMGVSGCGKSAVGQQLAELLQVEFVEGDAWHSADSIARMAAGIALTDADRADWLHRLQERVAAARAAGVGLVLACSALKRRYRDLLREGDPALCFAHLDGAPALIAQRMSARTAHFMPTSLLQSQLRDLEPLAADECGMRLDIAKSAVTLAREIAEFHPPSAPHA